MDMDWRRFIGIVAQLWRSLLTCAINLAWFSRIFSFCFYGYWPLSVTAIANTPYLLPPTINVNDISSTLGQN
jgi:predicted AlkP superfamily pyrophosphatase or phosphodiesterase